MKDDIMHPKYYNRGTIEVKDVIRDWGLNFNIGNTMKYIARAGYKGDAIKDLLKASNYIDFELDYLYTHRTLDGFVFKTNEKTKYPLANVLEDWNLPYNLTETINCIRSASFYPDDKEYVCYALSMAKKYILHEISNMSMEGKR